MPVIDSLKGILEAQIKRLSSMPIEEMLEQRYQRLMSYGQFTEK